MKDVFFGAIADDFTGASDLAAMIARAGVPVTLRIGLPADGGSTAFEVIALKTRTVPPEDAVAQSCAALRWLRARGAERVFFKYCSTFDSTPRGNIGPVAEALMSEMGVDRTIHCPAFPENGRRVFMGHLFVGEAPLHESPMKDHPLTPMRDSDLVRLLAAQAHRPVVRVTLPVVRGEALPAVLEEVSGHAVVDAVEEADLASVARAVAGMPLICGGSAVAAPLATIWRQGDATGSAPPPPTPGPGRLVLSGSCSEMTRVQVATYLETAAGFRLDPVELDRGGLAAARDWLAAQPPEADKIVFATAEPREVAAAQQELGAARAGSLVEEALARLALDAKAAGLSRIVVAGGETSGAVTRAIGVDALRIGPEIAPGVPWCFAADGLALALKSGNFGARTFFADAFALLDAGGAGRSTGTQP
jgi:uncharacterized protein YgbK (DUF1537 family)